MQTHDLSSGLLPLVPPLATELTRIWASLSHLLNITDREYENSYPEKSQSCICLRMQTHDLSSGRLPLVSMIIIREMRVKINP